MMQIPLQQLPNQSFSVQLDDNSWNFLIKTVGDVSIVSLDLNGEDVIDSTRAVAGGLIIPYQYLESGNFFFVTQGQQLPYYTQFGVTQNLIYISAIELANLRSNPNPSRITAANFNPLGALPLRFSPQGYVGA